MSRVWMPRRFALACGTFALILQLSKAGAETPYGAPDYSKPTVWRGFYLGGQAGYDWSSIDVGQAGITSALAAGRSLGIHSGYNWQMGPLVTGLEWDANMHSHYNQSASSAATFQAKSTVDSSLRARVGVSVGSFLIYGTGGVSVTQQTAAFVNTIQSSQTSQLLGGLTYGGGIELMVLPSLSIKAEALHYTYRNATMPIGSASIGIEPTNTVVRAGVTLHFN